MKRARALREDAGEEVLMIAQVFPLRVGERGAAAGGGSVGACVQQREPLGLVHRQRLQHQGVHETEDRHVRADAERQRQHRDGAHRRRLPHQAKGEAEVAAEGVEEAHARQYTNSFVDGKSRTARPAGERARAVAAAIRRLSRPVLAL